MKARIEATLMICPRPRATMRGRRRRVSATTASMLRATCAASRDEQDGMPATRELEREGAADAARRAGDDGPFVLVRSGFGWDHGVLLDVDEDWFRFVDVHWSFLRRNRRPTPAAARDAAPPRASPSRRARRSRGGRPGNDP